MLTALETGMKRTKWHSLMDKVWASDNLAASARKVIANGGSAGIDRQNVRQFALQEAAQTGKLQRQLKAGAYRPQAVRRVWIPKPGSKELRPLGIPAVRDRVVQTALRHVIEPIFERDFAPHSYGFRPGRGCKEALGEVDRHIKAGRHWVVDADLKSYFDTIPHEKLMRQIGGKIADRSVLGLMEAMLKAGVMESGSDWKPTQTGAPQGAVISPLLANIYLDPLDWEMARAGREMIRYADDFVILSKSEEEAKAALEAVKAWVEHNGLELHPEKTRIVDARAKGGFDFLGYHFERGWKWPRKKSMDKLKEAIRGKTRRTEGRSLGAIIADLNRTLGGWFEYFKHSNRVTFESVDKYTRGRLQSILRRRNGMRGRGCGFDRNRWPKAYFTAQGLTSLVQAHGAARQSLQRG